MYTARTNFTDFVTDTLPWGSVLEATRILQKFGGYSSFQRNFQISLTTKDIWLGNALPTTTSTRVLRLQEPYTGEDNEVAAAEDVSDNIDMDKQSRGVDLTDAI